MDQKTRTEIELALKHARQLVAALEALLPEGIAVPDEIQKLVARHVASRICLSCLKQIKPDEREKRGNHVACYSTQRARIRAGTETEENLVLTGKLTASAKRPGRRAALDLAADDLVKTMLAADAKETYDKKGKRKL
jgi:hypothetical protein